MGFIRSAIDNAVGAVSGTVNSQYKTAITCEDMGNQVLMVKKTGEQGIIRDGSVIIVNPGQLAVMVDNGRIVDATAEQGTFEFHSAATPSFFSGSFGGVFREMWQRFSFGGGAWQDQAVYFINIKEIMDNGFGTPSPIMYRDWEHQLSDMRSPSGRMPMRVALRCRGNYTFRINDPAQFLSEIGGTRPIYNKDLLCDQMRIEIISVFQAVTNSLCSEENQIFPLDLPGQSFFIKELMDKQEFDKQIQRRGIKVLGFNVISVELDEESRAKIDRYERSGDSAMQADKITTAVQMAASNEAGANVGFLGVGMMNNVLGGGMNNLTPQGGYPQPQQPYPQQPMGYQQPPAYAPQAQPQVYAPAQMQQPNAAAMPAAVSAACTNCNAAVTGPFCSQCGTPAPAPPQQPVQGGFCSQCGSPVAGPFCSKCGAKQ